MPICAALSTLIDVMADAPKPNAETKPEAVAFPVEVTVNGVRVTVTLMLRPGVTVVREPDDPEPPKAARPQ